MNQERTTTFVTVSNGLSLLRMPLALIFLFDNPVARCSAIVLAMVTDVLDGYLARRSQQTSQFGAILDPLADKFFALFALTVLLIEGRLTGFEMAALLGRDFAVVLFASYLFLSGHWSQYHVRAIWCGKVATTLQFLVLIALSLGYVVPLNVYWISAILGLLSLMELIAAHRR